MFGRRAARWTLLDGERMHARHPRRFFVPDEEERRTLRPGARVRLAFEQGRTQERLWVEVTAATGGAYEGRPLTAPQAITGVGATVAFEPRHVLTIAYDAADLGYPPAEEALVERRILARDRPPDRVIRHGGRWLAHVGDGDPDEPATTVTLAQLTDRWPALAEPFRAGAGDWRRAGDRYTRA